MIIDLRSDTFTKPSPEMLEMMFAAQVGDDVFGEDPSINALEEKTAALFGMEAGLFCASGTQTNQVAINVHTRPGDDVICDQYAHIRFYEGGGIAANSGASVSPIAGDRGILNESQVRSAIKVDNVHFPRTRLLALENTSNKGGGTIYSLSNIKKLGEVARENNLAFHLDGARVFNAIVESDYGPQDLGAEFDSISICLSKGLGAPVGSVLVGSKDFIHQARRVRKRFGGGMRQAGYLAAAGIFALDNNIDRLRIDHDNAKLIASVLTKMDYVESIDPVETNIAMINLKNGVNENDVLTAWEDNGVKALSLGPGRIRVVTHLDITQEMMSGIEERFAINIFQ